MTTQSFQAEIDAVPPGGVLTLTCREYPGPITVRRSLSLQGSGATIWSLAGPALTVVGAGTRARLSDLRIEVTDETEEGDVGQPAIRVETGATVEFDRVRIRGSVEGLAQEPGPWSIPRSLYLGRLRAGETHEFILRLIVGAPCQIESLISGLRCDRGGLDVGRQEVRLRVEPVRPDTLLLGHVVLKGAVATRMISVSAHLVDDAGAQPGRDGFDAPVIFQPASWDEVVPSVAPASPPLPPKITRPQSVAAPAVPPAVPPPDPAAPAPPPSSAPITTSRRVKAQDLGKVASLFSSSSIKPGPPPAAPPASSPATSSPAAFTPIASPSKPAEVRPSGDGSTPGATSAGGGSTPEARSRRSSVPVSSLFQTPASRRPQGPPLSGPSSGPPGQSATGGSQGPADASPSGSSPADKRGRQVMPSRLFGGVPTGESTSNHASDVASSQAGSDSPGEAGSTQTRPDDGGSSGSTPSTPAPPRPKPSISTRPVSPIFGGPPRQSPAPGPAVTNSDDVPTEG